MGKYYLYLYYYFTEKNTDRWCEPRNLQYVVKFQYFLLFKRLLIQMTMELIVALLQII